MLVVTLSHTEALTYLSDHAVKLFKVGATLLTALAIVALLQGAQHPLGSPATLFKGVLLVSVATLGILYLLKHTSMNGIALAVLAGGLGWSLSIPIIRLVAIEVAAAFGGSIPAWMARMSGLGVSILTLGFAVSAGVLCIVIATSERAAPELHAQPAQQPKSTSPRNVPLRSFPFAFEVRNLWQVVTR